MKHDLAETYNSRLLTYTINNSWKNIYLHFFIAVYDFL